MKAEPKPPPAYRHPEIQEFHSKWAAHPIVKEEKKEVIEAILAILDREGDCPSVVQKNSSETERKYDPNVFDRLAGIPLWRHSLEVATQLAGAMNQAMLIPDALITGLGHDLGKIPAYQDTLYLTGDHPIISIIVLNKLPGFESMSNREEISLSIRQHHLLNPESTLGRALKEADHQVRLLEISRQTPDPAQARTIAQAPLPPKSSPEKKRPAKSVSEKRESHLPPIPNKEKGEDVAQCESADPDFDLSTLDLEHMLRRLSLKINKVVKGRWSIISTPEGWVLAQPDVVWDEAKRLAKNAPIFLTADADEQRKREMLKAIVQRLSAEKQAIATELLGEGYYTTQCLVINPSGKSIRIPLIPFRVEVFGYTPSAMESIKNPILKEVIKKVRVGNAQKMGRNE
ncbi:MAG: HD domain-containing protein [Desulfuromonadales bacterium]|nr:HD domain-containing protein [Desulfuromonadales bacterium]